MLILVILKNGSGVLSSLRSHAGLKFDVFQVVDLPYQDGSAPSADVINEWIEFLQTKRTELEREKREKGNSTPALGENNRVNNSQSSPASSGDRGTNSYLKIIFLNSSSQEFSTVWNAIADRFNIGLLFFEIYRINSYITHFERILCSDYHDMK